MPSRFDFVDGLYSQPVSAVPTVISQHVRPLNQVANRDVEINIIVDISERRGQATLFLKTIIIVAAHRYTHRVVILRHPREAGFSVTSVSVPSVF